MNSKVFKRNKTNMAFIIVLFSIIIWHILTLSNSPIVWFDEVFMASITDSFIHGKGFVLGISGDDSPMFFYGPIFFIIESLFIKIGGFSPFCFRLVGVLFCFATVAVIYGIIKKRRCNGLWGKTLCILFLLDPLVISMSHSGRMEFVATFFLLLSYYFYERYHDDGEKKNTYLTLLFLLLSVFSTFRVVVVAAPLAIALVIRIIQNKHWVSFASSIILPTFLLLLWLLYSFGSLSGIASLFAGSGDSNGSLLRFIGGNLKINPIHYILIFLLTISVAHSIKHKYFNDILLYLLPIVLFYIIVHDNGGYSCLILPSYFLIIAEAVDKMQPEKAFKLAGISLLTVYAFACLVVFTGKTILIADSHKQRDHKAMSEWVKSNIDEGSSVVCSYAYYYACHDLKCDIRCYGRYEASTPDIFQPEYLIVSRTEDEENLYETSDLNISKVSEYNVLEENQSLIPVLLYKYLRMNVGNSNYAGTIYKVER